MSILSIVASAAIDNSETLIIVSDYARIELIIPIRNKKKKKETIADTFRTEQ